MKLIMTEKTFLYCIIVLQSFLAWGLYFVMNPAVMAWGEILISRCETFELGVVLHRAIIAGFIEAITIVFAVAMFFYVYTNYLVKYQIFIEKRKKEDELRKPEPQPEYVSQEK